MSMEIGTVQTAETREATQVWAACLDLVRERVNTQSFKTWFEPIVPLHLRAGSLTVQVPSQFFYDWLEEHYYGILTATIQTVLGKDARLEYSVRSEDAAPSAETELLSFRPDEQGSLPARIDGRPITGPLQSPPPAELKNFQSSLNPRYTFDTFIKGESNQLARAAASAVANNPGGTSFNPLVIYGGTGLGKTHLIQAIGNFALANGKAARVMYISSEKFTVEFVSQHGRADRRRHPILCWQGEDTGQFLSYLQ